MTSQALSVRNNKLTAVPASLGQLSMLQVLDLQHNSISSFASVAKLEKLENLDIQYNNLETLPQGTPLVADGTRIVSFFGLSFISGTGLGSLKSLKRLHLKYNHIKELPREIGDLDKLEELDLEGNRLTGLPTEISKLKNLHKIYLSRNMLAELPDELGQLKSLEELFLNDNQLTNLGSVVMLPGTSTLWPGLRFEVSTFAHHGLLHRSARARHQQQRAHKAYPLHCHAHQPARASRVGKRADQPRSRNRYVLWFDSGATKEAS